MNIIIQFFIGYIIVDFLSSFFHWIEDTYLNYNIDIPIISSIAKDNTLHHFYPRSILAYSPLENMQNTFILTIIIILIIYIINKSFIYKYPIIILTILILGTIGNYIHAIAHMRDCEKSKFILLLQKLGIIISNKEHSFHHATNSSVKYSVYNSYTNYIYDYLNIWRIFEYLIFIVFNIKPCYKPIINQYERYFDDTLDELMKQKCPRKLTKQEINDICFRILNNIHRNNKNICATYI